MGRGQKLITVRGGLIGNWLGFRDCPGLLTQISTETVEDIDHTRTKAKSPQTNGICERFHKTVLNEFYRVAFRKKIYKTLEELQTDLEASLKR